VKYRTLVADPPWGYPGMSLPWRSSVEAHYDTMSVEAICALPIGALADRDAHLYLWAVNPMLRDAYRVVRAWGFSPSTVLTWCKQGPGLGGGWRANTEHLIVARRGDLPFLTTGRGSWYVAKRGEHSQKPEVFMDMIEEMSPAPRLEVFARRHRLGWDVWGNESANTAQLEPSGGAA
jgi:N6-adenosine-specific RNA methylase IME4